jgi:hypothetical protein
MREEREYRWAALAFINGGVGVRRGELVLGLLLLTLLVI